MSLRITRHELALVGVTLVWATTFLTIRIAVRYVDPMAFVGLRFGVATLIAIAATWRALRSMTRRDLIAGLAIGVAIFVGYGFQTVGLRTIDSSLSGFITALYVPLVPLMQWGILRIRPGLLTTIGIALAFAGLILVTGPSADGISMGFGEMMTVISAVGCASETILIGAFAGKVDIRRVTVIQLATAAVLSCCLMPITGSGLPALDWRWILPAVWLGVASMVIQFAINWAQTEVSPTKATLIYTGEPVFAGFIGAAAGERLGPLAIFGAVLIVIGVLISQLRPTTPFESDTCRTEV